MEWCRLSTSYYLDAALLRAGEAAEVLFLRCIAYSGAQESKGLVPLHVLPMLTPTKTNQRVAALLREGLLEEAGENVRIRSWDRWQEALDSEAERRRKAREKKARQRAASRDEEGTSLVSVPGTKGGRSRGRPRHIEVEVEEEQKTSSSVARKRATATPDVFPITPEMAAWGREHASHVVDPKAETARFLDWTRANGKSYKDWQAAWRNWMSKANVYATERPVRAASGDLQAWLAAHPDVDPADEFRIPERFWR
jgi:hypothetical protein